MEGPEDLCPGLSARPASRQSSCIEGFSLPLFFFAAPFYSAFSSVLLGGLTASASPCCLCFTEVDVRHGDAPLDLFPLFASCLCQFFTPALTIKSISRDGHCQLPRAKNKGEALRVRVSRKTGKVTKALHVGLAEEARSPGSCTSTRAVFVKVKASMPCHSPVLFAALWSCETAAVS